MSFKKSLNRRFSPAILYQLWLGRNWLSKKRNEMTKAIARFLYQPTFSLLISTHRLSGGNLEKVIASVICQVYSKWELCVIDDGSLSPQVQNVIRECSARYPGIRIVRLDGNIGIAEAFNNACSMASGEFIGLLDQDGELLPNTLFEIARAINQRPDLDLIYTDEDQTQPNGRRHTPFFKPDWSPELLMSINYIHHSWVIRTSLLNKVGGWKHGFEWGQELDLLLRLTEQTDRIYHLPLPLYSRRGGQKVVSILSQDQNGAHQAGKKAIEDALQRRGTSGSVEDGSETLRYRVRYTLIGTPKISILIPTRDRLELLQSCIESITQKTVYNHFEIVVIDNDSTDPFVLTYLNQSPHMVLRYPGPFNYSQINNFGAAHATGEYLLFLNNDTEVISPEWLEAMLEQAQRPDVGVVGAKLLYPDRTIQHAGVIVGPNECTHAFCGMPSDRPTYFGLADVVREVSAVTGACMMMPKAVFQEVNGFDEKFEVEYNDIDLCMRVRTKGYRVIYTPYAMLYHDEGASRGRNYGPLKLRSNWTRFEEQWGSIMKQGDPFHNRNLSPIHGGFDRVEIG